VPDQGTGSVQRKTTLHNIELSSNRSAFTGGEWKKIEKLVKKRGQCETRRSHTVGITERQTFFVKRRGTGEEIKYSTATRRRIQLWGKVNSDYLSKNTLGEGGGEREGPTPASVVKKKPK